MSCAVLYDRGVSYSLFTPQTTIPVYDKLIRDVERTLDCFGLIPIVSLVSGSLRILMGQVQAVAWGVIGMLALMCSMVQPDFHLENVAIQSFHYAVHGVGNVLRGFVEGCFLVGNITCLFYTLVFRLRYPSEMGDVVALEETMSDKKSATA
ncbi:MAG: hypothetical protein WCP39_02440 [Chlamydiota bacterium]